MNKGQHLDDTVVQRGWDHEFPCFDWLISPDAPVILTPLRALSLLFYYGGLL